MRWRVQEETLDEYGGLAGFGVECGQKLQIPITAGVRCVIRVEPVEAVIDAASV
ncbi:hypothetical protein [Paludibaculum fermentans]|uniref:hypothetical protein n=1 Tax=Paludibaculum fermentans TaxID=1473598 RepID=UPI003EBE9D9D